MGLKVGKTKVNAPTKERSNMDDLLKKEIRLFGNTFNSKKKEQFYTELSVLLTSGIRLKDALSLIATSQKKKEDASFYEELSAKIVTGSAFSDVLRDDKKFTVYESHSVRIGEEGGSLEKVTSSLADFYTRKNEQRRNITSALTYPIIVLLTAFLAVTFMLQFVVPMFKDVFNQNNVDLPRITEIVIALSEWLGTYGWIILGILVLFGISQNFLNNNPRYRSIKDHMLLKIPLIGPFIKASSIARFTQAVSLLVNSKVSIPQSIHLAKEMSSFTPLKSALDSVEKDIQKGTGLSKSLEAQSFFDAKMIALVRVAEETNQTEYVFDKLKEQYSTEVIRKSKMFSTLLEPVIILIVGVLVAVILISMYLPMFELGNVLK